MRLLPDHIGLVLGLGFARVIARLSSVGPAAPDPSEFAIDLSYEFDAQQNSYRDEREY